MCGRYVIAYGPEMLVHGFSATRVVPFPQRYNVAPQSQVPVVMETREGERIAELMRWGLVPHWAKDASIGSKLNNARAESIADKPSFRQAVRRRRCIIPASGFYEWQAVPAHEGGGKQPWYISPKGEPLFAFAGLFEAWRPKPATDAEAADWLLTCCIVTTAPNALMATIHDRMPVTLARDEWDAWLSRDLQDPVGLAPLMQGLPAEAMQAWPVARTVNRSNAEGAELIAPLAPKPDA
ncbi:MAG: SOS response-associated peptidase [Burkholderiales bacterium]